MQIRGRSLDCCCHFNIPGLRLHRVLHDAKAFTATFSKLLDNFLIFFPEVDFQPRCSRYTPAKRCGGTNMADRFEYIRYEQPSRYRERNTAVPVAQRLRAETSQGARRDGRSNDAETAAARSYTGVAARPVQSIMYMLYSKINVHSLLLTMIKKQGNKPLDQPLLHGGRSHKTS